MWHQRGMCDAVGFLQRTDRFTASVRQAISKALDLDISVSRVAEQMPCSHKGQRPGMIAGTTTGGERLEQTTGSTFLHQPCVKACMHAYAQMYSHWARGHSCAQCVWPPGPHRLHTEHTSHCIGAQLRLHGQEPTVARISRQEMQA